MNTANEMLHSGKDPNEHEIKSDTLEEDGSDSCPSDGNLDLKTLYECIYLEKHKALAKVQIKA